MTPLVFLPGAGGRISFFRPVADRLRDLGPTHVFGYPGFGEVPADASVRSLSDLFGWVLARLPAGACHVVAQSMGGVIASRLAIEHPERVAKLVLVATSGGVDVTRLGGIDWRPEYRAARPDVPSWFADDRTDLTDRLSTITAPTLLISGDDDPISPPAVGGFIAARIPNARTTVIAGGTHDFAIERVDETAALVRGHLEEKN